jgi:hypothetical protein
MVYSIIILGGGYVGFKYGRYLVHGDYNEMDVQRFNTIFGVTGCVLGLLSYVFSGNLIGVMFGGLCGVSFGMIGISFVFSKIK